VDASSHIGRSALVEGAIIGRSCDIRANARLHDGVAIGDEVVIGSESVVMPGVRIYPYKEVESGAHLFESLIWESRATSHLFTRDGVSGLVNVDLTPETAVRLAAALGTSLKRGARVVGSRESARACRMIKRTMLSGLNSTGVDVSDLRVLPSAVARHLLKTESYDMGFHVGLSPMDPEVVQVRFFEQPGVQLGSGLEKEIEKNFVRRELRLVGAADVGMVDYPARVRETYAHDLCRSVDADAIAERGYRIVVDYGYSAASYVLPLVLGPLGVESISAHGFSGGSGGEPGLSPEELLAQTRKLVGAVGADLGVVFDRAAERLFLVDESGRDVPAEQTLLLILTLLAAAGRTGTIAVPVTVTHHVDRMAEAGFQVVRTPHSLAALTRAAAEEGVVFAGGMGGGYVFPEFLPAYDAVASLAKLLELLAPAGRPLSELVGDLPQPWSMKGMVMRVVTERLKGRDLDLTDGIKVFDHGGWAQVLPDPDEPLVHVFAEGDTDEETGELAAEMRGLVESVLEEDPAAPERRLESQV
jgi:mannose-1-phosphate guanylyltransferase / phosphomannomutase